MKLSLFIFLFPAFVHAAINGMTENCPYDAEIIANEGDKFVMVRKNGKEEKLISVTGQTFSLQAKDPVMFRSRNLEFEMTSMVMSSLPRLTVIGSGVEQKCGVNIYGPVHKKQN